MQPEETAVIKPETAVMAGSWGTWQIIYSAGLKGIGVGGGVQVAYHSNLLPLFQIKGDWTAPQCDDPAGAGYTTAVTTGTARARVMILEQPKLPDLPQAPSRTFRVLIEETPLLPGESLILTLGEASQGGPGTCAQHIAQQGLEFLVSVNYDGGEKWTILEDSPRLDIIGGPVVQLRAYAPSVIETAKDFHLQVRPLDAFGHAASEFTVPLRLEAQDPAAHLPQGKGLNIFPVRLKSFGVQRITVTGGGYQAKSNPIMVESSPPDYNMYWGDIHGHSNFSDGLRSPDDYYRYARDVACLDFVALTDHEPGFGPFNPRPNRWALNCQKVREYDNPGNFVTFLGYEWTSGKFGHKCVYYLDEDQPVFSAWDPQSDTPAKLYASLEEKAAMVITHHPAGGPAPADLALIDPEREPLVEIYSCHGCSDAPEIGRKLWRFVEGKGFFVQDALDQGYHFGIIAGSDTHTSDPGNPLVEHPLFPHPYRVGIMAVYAKELTRQAIWEAFWARRVYATTGERILLDFKIDGHNMGEEFTLRKPPLIHMTVAGTAPLAQVELIRNGQVILSRLKPDLDLELDWQEDQVHAGYYYLRVTQVDGEMAWSSPIWVNSKTGKNEDQ